MASSDDFPVDDVWSSALREELFPEDNLRSFTWGDDTRTHSQNLPPPRPSLPSANTPSQQTFIQQQQHRLHNPESFNPPTSHFSASAPLQRKRSQFELPDFPLATDPTGVTSNSSGRPPFSSSSNQRQAHIPAAPPPVAHPVSAPRPASPSSSHDSLSTSESLDCDSSEDLNDFVDLTQESSPHTMPPVREKRRRNAIRGSLYEHLAEDSPNPMKRRKTGTEASHSSQRPRTIEEVDLRDVDNDKGLSRVLEQQRKATIAAQQEQASKPVKLSTLQCIICMESMKVLTATHCGHLFCHDCLMEALIAGENQGSDPGKGTPKCPVCRKKVIRPSGAGNRKSRDDVIPLAIKVKSRVRNSKGKGPATGETWT